MEPRDLDNAATFCKLVETPHLLAYLGLSEEVDPAEARAKLKSRRKFMQGMQANPKYRREALFLIKHFTSLSAVLEDSGTYLQDVQQRAESEHLPVLEMTVRGVLAGGGLGAKQEAYLRHNALELGISDGTFQHVLERIASEMEISLGGIAPTTLPTSLDLYGLLGIDPRATPDEITAAYEQRLSELEADDPALERLTFAKKVLSSEESRRHYDLTTARTGPPARTRESRPDLAETVRPTSPRSKLPGGASRLELLGDPVRSLPLRSEPVEATIELRNGGSGAMAGHAEADVPWLIVTPEQLDPTATEQTLRVRLDKATLPDDATAGVVTIETDRGERASVVFELKRSPTAGTVVGALVIVLLILGFAAGLVLQM